MFKKKLAIALGMVAVLSLTACSKGTVAKVNDTEITADDLKVAKSIITSVNEYKTGKDAEDMSKEEEEELEKNAATFLVDSEVVYQQAIADGITVKSEDNDSRTSELKEALKENPKFKKDLEDNGVTEEALENFIAKDNVINAYRDAFNEKQTVSDAEISAYYAKHREEFKKDMVDASHILFATVDRNQNAVSDEKKEEIKKTAEEVQKRAASGEDFAALAKKYSDDKKTGEKGGDLGYFTKDAKDALFTREVFKLKKGDVSKLIATNNGYEIVKINDIKSEIKELDKCKEEIKKKILDEKYIKHVEQLVEKAEVK